MDADKRREIHYCLLLVAILAVFYGLCQNGRWVPGGGDDALYMSMARDMAIGKTGLFRDRPATLASLGWPYALSWLMRISPSFWWLNAALMGCCLGAVCLWYWILLRFTSPVRASIVMLVVGSLFEWHRFTFTHYTEALFYLLMAAMILLALQIHEQRPAWWRIPLLVALGPMTLTVRWAGLALVSMPAVALVHGQFRPRWNRCWVTFVVLFAVTASTCVMARRTMSEHIRQVNERTESAEVRSETRQELHRDQKIVTGVAASPAKGLFRRWHSAGSWLSRLFWPPASALGGWPFAVTAAKAFGWGLIALVAVQLPAAIRRGQWLGIVALMLCGLFVVIWSRPVPRYLAPMAPMIVLGLWHGVERLLAVSRSPRRRQVARAVMALLLGSIVVCNVAILAVSIVVARSPDYVTRCQAGEHAELIGVARVLAAKEVERGEFAISAHYDDPNRRGQSDFAPRIIKILTGHRGLIPPPLHDREQLLAWAKTAKVRYLLTRPQGEKVTRAWHFRLGDTAGRPYYQLLELTDDGPRILPLPPVVEGVGRVPGL